jgi:hypothetical protein
MMWNQRLWPSFLGLAFWSLWFCVAALRLRRIGLGGLWGVELGGGVGLLGECLVVRSVVETWLVLGR